MERLRIELRRERDDLGPRHGVRLERQFLPRLEIFQIAQRLPFLCRPGDRRLCPSLASGPKSNVARASLGEDHGVPRDQGSVYTAGKILRWDLTQFSFLHHARREELSKASQTERRCVWHSIED